MTAGIASAKTEKLQIQGSKGKLSAITVTPDQLKKGEKCPWVILCHGFGGTKDEKSGMMKSLADTLASQGIASIRFDFNGHGESEGKFPDMTVLNEIEDAKCVYRYVLSLPSCGKVSILGHSQGAVVASMTAGELGSDSIDRVVLLSPAATLREDALRGSTFGKQYDPINPPAEIELWGGRNLGAEYVRTARTLPIYDVACQYTGPVCLVHGTDDRVAPYSFSQTYNREYPNSQLHLLDLDDHGLSKHFEEMKEIVTKFMTTPSYQLGAPRPGMKFAFEVRAYCDPAYEVGETPKGKRVVIPIKGGTFEGLGIKGEVLAGGADYQLVDEQHGRTELEAIYCIRTDDGVTIHVRNRGILTNKGYFRCTPVFEAPYDSPYAWLNDAVFVCVPAGGDGYISLNMWRVE